MFSRKYLGLFLGLLCVYNVHSDDEYAEDVSDLSSCMPQLADRCFSDVYASLKCHSTSSSKPKCMKWDISGLCSELSDALTCCSDIVDTDCSLESGRGTFDSWLKGLRSVNTFLCENNNIFKELLSSTTCWDGLAFVNCLEEIAGVNHVVDMLKVILDKNECNRILMAMTACNIKATTPNEMCAPPQDTISKIIFTVYSQTECGSICNNTSKKLISTDIMILSVFVKIFKHILFSL